MLKPPLHTARTASTSTSTFVKVRPKSDVPAYSSKGRLIRTSVRPQPTHVAIVWLRDEGADGVSSNTARITSVGWSRLSRLLLGYTNRVAILDRNILVNFTMLIHTSYAVVGFGEAGCPLGAPPNLPAMDDRVSRVSLAVTLAAACYTWNHPQPNHTM